MSSALANPDFAIICAFFERFSDLCGIEKQDTKQLVEWLQNTEDVHPELADIHMKLLRKLRKTVHATKWEKALIKFCYMSTTMQDAWEIERFGYKKASLAVKLRVLKALLEFQFDANVKFKNAINLAQANDLRGTPIGKDEFGNAYWYFIDDKCNIFIYEENSDDETWRLVASNREEFVQLIQRLKDRVPLAPPSDDIIDEEDSSNSQPAITLDTTPIVEDPKEAEDLKDEETTNKVASLKITLTNPDKDGVSEIVNKNEEEKQEEEETKPEVTSHSDSPLKITITTKSRKGTPKKLHNVRESTPEEVKPVEEVKEEIVAPKEESPEPEIPTPVKKGRGRGARKAKSPVKTPPKPPPVTKKQETPPKNPSKQRGGTARGGKRARRSGRNTRNHKASESDEVGSEVEEEVLHVRGEGSGAQNQAAVSFECSEVIEESVMYFHGEGSGYESLVGNPDPNDTNKDQAKATPVVKQSFFFGSPGCLKNRPMTAFGSSSLFSFGGQTTFGASSSLTKPTAELISKDLDEVDKDSSINLKSCNRFTTHKSLESLPVSKIGNTQNFEDIIDDDELLDDTKVTESKDSGCPNSENDIGSKSEPNNDHQMLNLESIPTPDEAPSLSEPSFTPPLTPPNPADASDNNDQTVNNVPPLPASPMSCDTDTNKDLETTNDVQTELHSELSISDIPLPEDSPQNVVNTVSEVAEPSTPKTNDVSVALSEIPLPEDELSRVSPSEIAPTKSEEALSEIPLPDDQHDETSDIPLPNEVSVNAPVADGVQPLSNDRKSELSGSLSYVVSQNSIEQGDEEANKLTSEPSPEMNAKDTTTTMFESATMPEEVSLSEIPLPPESSSDNTCPDIVESCEMNKFGDPQLANKIEEETLETPMKMLTNNPEPSISDVKDKISQENVEKKSEDVEPVTEIKEVSPISDEPLKTTNILKEKYTGLVPYDSEDSTSMSSVPEVAPTEMVQEKVSEVLVEKVQVKETLKVDVNEVAEDPAKSASEEQILDETSESDDNEKLTISEETNELSVNEPENLVEHSVEKEPTNDPQETIVFQPTAPQEEPNSAEDEANVLNIENSEDLSQKSSSDVNSQEQPEAIIDDSNEEVSEKSLKVNSETEFFQENQKAITDEIKSKDEEQLQNDVEPKSESLQIPSLNESEPEVQNQKEAQELPIEHTEAESEVNESFTVEENTEPLESVAVEEPLSSVPPEIPCEEPKQVDTNSEKIEDSIDHVPEAKQEEELKRVSLPGVGSLNDVSEDPAVTVEEPPSSILTQSTSVASPLVVEVPAEPSEVIDALNADKEIVEPEYAQPSKIDSIASYKTEQIEICNKPEELETSTDLTTKSDTSSSHALIIAESGEKSSTSQEQPTTQEEPPTEPKDETSEKPSSSISEPQIIEYQQKKKRARTESGSLKERILFRPQLDFIQNDVQPYTSCTEVLIPEQPDRADQVKIDVQPEKSSAEHSNVSSIEEQDASRGSRESNLAAAAALQLQQQRSLYPFEESQNANDALYASSTESSKADVLDDNNTHKYVSKREKAMQRTSFNDFSVSKLIGSNKDAMKETVNLSVESLVNDKTHEISTPAITVQNVEIQSSSPMKHSIESMMAKSPRSSPSPQSEQSMPLDLQKHPVVTEPPVVKHILQVEPETNSTSVVKELPETKRPRGRGRRKASNEFGSPEPKNVTVEPIVESPPSKKQQIETLEQPTKTEEPVVKGRGRGRKKSIPMRSEPTPSITETTKSEQPVMNESKRPRKSVSPEKSVPVPVVVPAVIAPEIISPEKIAPKLRAKALAKKSISQESPEKSELEAKTSEQVTVKANDVTKKASDFDILSGKEPVSSKTSIVELETVGRTTRTRQKRAANEPLVDTQIVKELKTDSTKTTPPKVETKTPSRSRKRRMSEEESRKRQSSESDNDVFDQSAEVQPSAFSESSEEDFIAPAGGKRAKMRGKQVDTSLRKEIESKKQQEIPTTSSASEDDPVPRTRGGRQTRRSGGTTQPIVAPVAEKKKEEKIITPTKSEKVEEPKEEPAKKDTHEEVKQDRRGKAKRRNEATNKSQVTNEVEAVAVKKEETLTKEKADTVDAKASPEEHTPINSPDSKKAKIETTPEKPGEPEPSEPKKRGGRPRKSITVTTPAETTPKKNINAVSSEIDQSNVIQTIDNDAPVRQSRRIAQAKIREEAERRKMEEIMLAQLKADNEKKKKQEAKDKDFVPGRGYKESSDSDDNEDSNESGSRKRGRAKKKKDKKSWKTSDESSEEEAEEEHSDQHSEPDVRHAALKSDHEFSCESEDEDAQAIPTKRARTVKKEDQSDSDDDNPEHACQKCHKTDHPEWILLCDSCDKGYHCSCLKPVLFLIPEGDWFCPPCQHNKLIETLEQKLLDYDFLTRQMELAEIHRQREEKLVAEQEEAKRVEKERCDAERMIEEAAIAKNKKSSGSSNSESSTASEDDKPLYKLRRRNQVPVTYRFNDYDDMINRAIKRDMDEVEEANQGSGNAGRGKDISTIIEADKEEKRRQSMALDEGEPRPGDEKEPGETSESDSDKDKDNKSKDSNDEPIRRPSKKSSSSKKGRKKPRRKLNQLDLSSDEDDPTDESFKGSSDNSSDEEENFSASSAETESSLELAAYRRKSNKDGRPYATRRRRPTRIETFINDNDSGEESDVKPTRKKKKKSDSEEFELSDESDDGSGGSEESEDVDSEELCDDSDSDSDSEYRWSKRKKKRESSGVSTQAAGKQPRKGFGKKRSGKRVEDEDKSFRAGISKKKILSEKKKDESDDSDDTDKPIRKTRGRQMHYLEDDFESSDEGIKPGVFRPDTPPEEREAFIRKQEEIKRMLAEKNAEAAKALATPTISGAKPDLSIDPPTDNISIIPASIIENAKVLDSDYHKIKPGQSVFYDLPDDFNPDEMDDEELAKMMEEEDFANHQLKLAGDSKNKKLKEGESPSKKPLIMPDPSVLPTNLVKLPKLVEKKLKKKKEEDGEPPTMIQAPIVNIPTEAENARRDLSKPPHMQIHPNAPPNVTIGNQAQLSGRPTHMHQQHGPLPHPYQGGIPRYPPGSLPPHLHGIQPPFVRGHAPPLYLSDIYPPNMRPSNNLHPALEKLMHMPPNPSQRPRHHGPPSLMNPLIAMSQMPAGTGPLPPQMNRNVPPSALQHKDPSVPVSSVITHAAPPPHIAQQQPPVMQQAPPQRDHPPPHSVPEDTSPVKKRGRRKKITPLRDDLPKNDPAQSMMQMKPEFKAQGSAIPTDGPKLSVVGQPQLFSLTQSAPASVITRVIPQAPTLPNITKSSPGSTLLPQPPQHYTKSPPHPTRGPNPSIMQNTGAGATQPSPAPPKSSPHLPSEPGRLAALHAQPPNPYRHSPSGVIYHGGPPPGPGRVYHEPVPIHHRIHHTGPPPAGTPPAGSRSPSQRPGVYPGQYPPPHHIPPPHQFGPYPFPGGPPSTTAPPLPNAENRSPAHSTSSAGSPYQPPGNRTPQNFANDDERTRSGSAGAASGGNNSNSGGAGEFSGLVSYFSSQHDDLNS